LGRILHPRKKRVLRTRILQANRICAPHTAIVNGSAGLVVTDGGRPAAVVAFTITHGRIVELDLADRKKLRLAAADQLQR
jgi:hypothetical protein